jgi:hypothetical protein
VQQTNRSYRLQLVSFPFTVAKLIISKFIGTVHAKT